MKESSNGKSNTACESAVRALLPLLGFRKALVGDRWERSFPGVSAPLEVDCDAGAFLNEYAQQIKPFLAAYARKAAILASHGVVRLKGGAK